MTCNTSMSLHRCLCAWVLYSSVSGRLFLCFSVPVPFLSVSLVFLRVSGVYERVLSTLLNEMDGIEAIPGVVIVGATTRVEAVDKALLRPGRFDECIEIRVPSVSDRLALLQVLVSQAWGVGGPLNGRRWHSRRSVSRLSHLHPFPNPPSQKACSLPPPLTHTLPPVSCTHDFSL
jgi:hypothetical protein